MALWFLTSVRHTLQPQEQMLSLALKELSQDMLLTARLQGTRYKTQSGMLRETDLHQNMGSEQQNQLYSKSECSEEFLTLLFQSCFYLATYHNKTTWWKVTQLHDSDPVNLLVNPRLLQIRIQYLRHKHKCPLELSSQSSPHELHLWPGHLMRHPSSVLALISHSPDWEVTCGLWGSHSWQRQPLFQEKKKFPCEEWCIKPLTNKTCVVCYQSKYLQMSLLRSSVLLNTGNYWVIFLLQRKENKVTKPKGANCATTSKSLHWRVSLPCAC